MKTRNLLPRAGAATLAFAGLGAGVALAYVADSSAPGGVSETIAVELRKAAHCMVAAIAPDLTDAKAAKAYAEGPVPLWRNLGALSYPVSTKNAEAQAYYNSHQAEFRQPATVTMSHIQVKDEKAAQKILKQARAGKPEW